MASSAASLVGECIDLGLNAVPETMLWILHNRADYSINNYDPEWFKDPKAEEIYKAIDYDYERSFGEPDHSHAIRSKFFDDAVLEFWQKHPNGNVVNFGEGLETQRFRLQEFRAEDTLWITLDVPDAMAAREKFITPDESNLHVAASVLDFDAWVPLIPSDKPVFFTAQGLFMYLEEEDNKRLFQKIAEAFPGSTVQFDNIAKWLSDKASSEEGWKKTPHYTTPKMPFGVNKFDAAALFESWVPGIQVEEIPWSMEKSRSIIMRYVTPFFMSIPYFRGFQPGMVFRVTFPKTSAEES